MISWRRILGGLLIGSMFAGSFAAYVVAFGLEAASITWGAVLIAGVFGFAGAWLIAS